MSNLIFWPEDIVNGLPASPLTVFKQAGVELGQLTKGALEVDLHQYSNSVDSAGYYFVLVSKAMNFRYSLFSASFSIVKLYPCSVSGVEGDKGFVADTEDELRLHLAELLRTPKVLSVVKAMLAQSR